MDTLKKSRTIIIILAILLLVTLSALATVLYRQHRESIRMQVTAENRQCSATGSFLQNELGLTETQLSSVEESCGACRGSSQCLRDNLRDKKKELIDELSREPSDTARLNKIAAEFGTAQSDVVRMMIRQYLEIKTVCTPEQRKKLASLYSELFGGCGSGTEKGRHGKNAPEAGDCCGNKKSKTQESGK